MAPWSYLVRSDKGDLRQNRKHLVPRDLTEKAESTEVELLHAQPELPDEEETEIEQVPENAPMEAASPESLSEGTYCTRSGKLSKPPDRFWY